MSTVSDDFNRADSANLGANWTNWSGDKIGITSNAAAVKTGGDSFCTGSYYNTPLTTDDHYAQITIVNMNGVNCSPYVRGNASTSANGYAVFCNVSSITIYSITGANLGSSIASYGAAANGDIIKLQASSNTLQVFKNGSSLGAPVTNSTYTTGKSVGIAFYDGTLGATPPSEDDFTASDLGVSFIAGKPFFISQAVNRAARY